MPPRFRVEKPSAEQCVVRVAENCGGASRSADDETLLETALAECSGTLALDLSETTTCTSVWLRFFYVLTVRAQRMGKSVVLVGLKEVVRETTDLLALSDKLAQVATLEEAWSA